MYDAQEISGTPPPAHRECLYEGRAPVPGTPVSDPIGVFRVKVQLAEVETALVHVAGATGAKAAYKRVREFCIYQKQTCARTSPHSQGPSHTLTRAQPPVWASDKAQTGG